jgi:ketosteroid isomerase-like protein
MPDDSADHRSTAEAAARRIVESFLEASMVPDPVRARTFMAPDVKITFTGGRKFGDPAGTAAFNAARYRTVKKKFERTDVVAGGTDDETIVYNTGTLYGEWPDGEPFAGNRYVDRFVVSRGRIVRMDVWNDSAEILLVRAGLAKM